MKRKMKKLTAVGELRLHTMAREGWRYLQSVCGESDDREWERQLWAVANNAALVALSTSYLGSPIFTSAPPVRIIAPRLIPAAIHLSSFTRRLMASFLVASFSSTTKTSVSLCITVFLVMLLLLIHPAAFSVPVPQLLLLVLPFR